MADDNIDGVAQVPSKEKVLHPELDPVGDAIKAARKGPDRPCQCCRTDHPGQRYGWHGVQLALTTCPMCNGTKRNGVLSSG